ncbi:Retrovirus-related Pol polyprotein from transposon, partial [Nosema granulosis]
EVDLIGRIPGDNTNSFLLVAIDHYSKWIETRILNTKSGREVASAIEEIIIKRHGTPRRILSDCGLEFKNQHISELQKKYRFGWEYSSPEHHNTVGAVERVNQTLWNCIKKLTEFGRLSWKKAVEKATFAINISFNRAIGTSPYILRWAKAPLFEIDKEFGVHTRRFQRDTLINKRNKNFEKYKSGIEKGNIVAKDNLYIGEKVLIYRENNSDKLKENWHPGFEITDKILPDAFIVKKDGKFLRVNKSQIKKDTSEGGREVS